MRVRESEVGGKATGEATTMGEGIKKTDRDGMNSNQKIREN